MYTLGWAHQLSYMCGVVNKKKKIPPLPPQGSPAGSPAEQVAPSGGATSGVGIAFVFFPSFSFLFNSGRSPREFLFGLTRKNTKQHGKTRNNTEQKTRKTRKNTDEHWKQTRKWDSTKKRSRICIDYLRTKENTKKRMDGWMVDLIGIQISIFLEIRFHRKRDFAHNGRKQF